MDSPAPTSARSQSSKKKKISSWFNDLKRRSISGAHKSYDDIEVHYSTTPADEARGRFSQSLGQRDAAIENRKKYRTLTGGTSRGVSVHSEPQPLSRQEAPDTSMLLQDLEQFSAETEEPRQYDIRASEHQEQEQKRILLPTNSELQMEILEDSQSSIEDEFEESAAKTVALLDTLTDWEDAGKSFSLSRRPETSPQRMDSQLGRENSVASISFSLNAPPAAKNYRNSISSSASLAQSSQYMPMLQNKLLDMTSQNTMLEQRIARMEREWREMIQERDFYRTECDAVQFALDQRNHEHDDLVRSMKRVETSNQMLTDRLEKSDTKIHELNMLVLNSEDSRKDMQSDLRTAASTIQKLSSDRSEFHALYQAEKVHAEDVTRDFEAVAQRCQHLQETSRRLADDNTSLRDQLQSASESMSKVRSSDAHFPQDFVSPRSSSRNVSMSTPRRPMSAQLQSPRLQEHASSSPTPHLHTSPQRPHTTQDMQQSVSAIIQKTKKLELSLQDKMAELQLVESEFARIPVSGGTPPVRRRRVQLERHLDQVTHEVGEIRMALKSYQAL